MDKSMRWKVGLPMMGLGALEFAGNQLAFGGAHRLGLGLKVEYAAWALFLLAGVALSAYSVVMFVRLRKRQNLKIEDAVMFLTGFVFGLLPIATILLLVKLRYDF